MLVKEYKSGNVTVRIHDDAYINKTKKDIAEILRRIEKRGREVINEHFEKERSIQHVSN